MVADRTDALLAHNGCDADVIREEPPDARVEAIIPRQRPFWRSLCTVIALKQ